MANGSWNCLHQVQPVMLATHLIPTAIESMHSLSYNRDTTQITRMLVTKTKIGELAAAVTLAVINYNNWRGARWWRWQELNKETHGGAVTAWCGDDDVSERCWVWTYAWHSQHRCCLHSTDCRCRSHQPHQHLYQHINHICINSSSSSVSNVTSHIPHIHFISSSTMFYFFYPVLVFKVLRLSLKPG